MKQTILMALLLIAGTIGQLALGPFIGVAVYYLFAVLRPQYLWAWALPEFNWSFYVGAATMVAAFLYLPRTFRGKNFSWVHWAMLGFTFCITLSHLFAVIPDISSFWYWEYFKIFLMFFCSTFVIKTLDHVKHLYLIAVFALGYIAYEMNFLYLVFGRMDIYNEGFGGLDNNGAGLMIAMGIPLAYFLWQAYRQWWRWLFLALVPIMLHAVLMSFSRGAMISLVAVCPLLLIRSKRRGWMILFFVGIAFILPILAGQEIRDRFFSVQQYQEDASAQSRLTSWSTAWKIAKDNPVTGVGLRNTEIVAIRRYGAQQYTAVHSQYLQIAADSGFLAISFYLLILYGSWKSLRVGEKRWRKSTAENEQLAYNLASGIESALLVFCVGASFLSLDVFELPYLLILLALKLPLTVPQEAATSAAAVPSLINPATAYAKA